MQQIKSFGITINRDRQRSLLEHGIAETFMVEKQFLTNMFRVCLYKSGYSFRRFNCNRELIPDCWRSYRESTFANIKLSFFIKKVVWKWIMVLDI